ncbi:MAG: hypothetical protein ACYDIA_09600 [Candidatus Humimicrobiaceae bacterium]
MKDPKITPLQVFDSSDFIGKTCKVEIDYCDKKEYKLARFPDLEMCKCGLRSKSEQEKIIPELAKAHISNLIKKNQLPKEECITIYSEMIAQLKSQRGP